MTYAPGSQLPGGGLTAGAIIQFAVPTASSGPLGITSAPDGKTIWFTESAAGKIGQLDPATGVISEFPIPISNGPEAITSAGGNLWFVLGGGGLLDSINPITDQFAVPTSIEPNFTVAGLVADGNLLWFTDNVHNQIGYFNTTTAAFAALSTASPSSPLLNQPIGIALGADGNLWFAQAGNNEVGQAAISAIARPTIATTTNLSFATTTSIVGQSTTFTATVAPISGTGTPSGSVLFSVDGQQPIAVPLQVINGQDQASFTTSSLSLGQHTVSAVYGGDSSYIPSSSTTAAVTIHDGPTILSVQRMGVHALATTIVLTFSEPLDADGAQQVSNYQLTTPQGRPIRIRKAVYDSATNSVTLHPAIRLSLRRVYGLTVVASIGNLIDGSGRVAGVIGEIKDLSGLLLDGAGNGQPGSNFYTSISRANLVRKR
jgi:hypothetical protein